MPLNEGDRYPTPKTQPARAAVVAAARATKDVAARYSIVTALVLGEVIGYIARGLR